MLAEARMTNLGFSVSLFLFSVADLILGSDKVGGENQERKRR